MSNDIRSIIERLAILEGRITPTTLKPGLNPQQKTVPQLPALFKPKHISVLKSKTDPEHPMHDYAVGASESACCDKCECDPCDCEVLDEAQANEEKLLDKVSKSLKDYLTNVEHKYKDDNLSKKAVDKDLGKKDKKDHDLLTKALAEDPITVQVEPADVPAEQPAGEEGVSIKECGTPIRTITFEDGRICEIHGDKTTGFEIRHGNSRLPSRFRSLEQAEMALEMFQARCRRQPSVDVNADYIEEK